ncbi:DUF7674 family protein [Paractinoplanes rishiriensis]|uniref:DUF7674 domain-containing protein n=1 Tax=Paractinoplanes rishiriensis TaxID=1050105 RepID=A0A919K7U3_9ACTN|nr:hypothetical protein [Actinoplanes rishiriensis]GIF01669.1 hypothetical protein Ari01nite_91330 [Actinoplanes rishiriensis]
MKYSGFRDDLWDVLPESREHILIQELYEACRAQDTTDLSAYTLLSEAFFHPVLVEAAEQGNVALARRCIELIEQLLASGDELLTGAARIRVVDKVGHSPALGPLLRRYAGPLTRDELATVYADATFLPPGDPFLPPAEVDDGRPPANALFVRDWLWVNVPMSREHVVHAELSEAKATMSLRAMTPDRYFIESVAPMLSDARLDAEQQHDPSILDEARGALALMRADADMAPLVKRHADSL